MRWIFALLLACVGLTGCATASRHGVARNGAETGREEVAGAEADKPKPKIKTIQKWNPIWWFGNADEPEPPDWYRPEDPNRRRKWYWRNPLHNFTFYVIGIADKPFKRSGSHPEHVFNPKAGWTWAVCRYKWWRLPFLSYTRGHCSFYVGWRERGNFGFKLTLQKQRVVTDSDTDAHAGP
ncbi:MAG: hypothetical protein AB1705_01280 [Verrucomicrobiota bacterium]